MSTTDKVRLPVLQGTIPPALPLQNASLAVDAAEGVARVVLEMTIDQRLRWLDEGAWGVHGTSISWR